MDSKIYNLAVRGLSAIKHHTGTAGFTNVQKIEVSEAAIRLFETYIVELNVETTDDGIVETTDAVGSDVISESVVETGPGA